MPCAAEQPHYTPEEYLALERKADRKSEYVHGQVIAMAGASRIHNLIAGNFYREASQQLRGRPCEAHGVIVMFGDEGGCRVRYHET
jgi:Uma2 family endonuclease